MARSILDIARGRTAASPSARVAGALARQAGQSFETTLNAVNAWYDLKGEAAIEKVNAPTAGSPKGGRGLRFAGPSTVDYFGTYVAGARPDVPAHRRGIAFDAKSVTGEAALGVSHVGTKNRVRFLAQVGYLRGLRDRHGYAAFFLCHCSKLATIWVVTDLDTLAAGESVPLRTKPRPTLLAPAPAIIHHQPHRTCSPDRAHLPQLDTRRPGYDYLALL